MNCQTITFSGHAIQRMFERNLTKNDILLVIQHGEIIANYPEDQPYPSCLLLGFIANNPLHVVLAQDSSKQCYVITTYVPNQTLWNDDFKSRRK
jgi:hypothetical protein